MITLSPEAKEPESKLSTPATAKPSVQDPEAVVDRSVKAEYALSTFPDVQTDNLTQSFALGFEDQIRDQALVSVDIRERKKRLNLVSDIAKQAAAEGRSISSIERNYIMGLSMTDLQNNQATILEQLWAERFIDDAIDESDVSTEPLYGDAIQEDAAKAVGIRDTAVDLATKSEVANRILGEVQQRLSEASWLGTGIDVLKSMIPFYSDFQRRNRIQGTGAGGFFLGSNMQEQIRGLYLQSPADFEINLRTAVNELAQENLLEAVSLASAAVSYTYGDEAWDNAFTLLDAADVATLGGTLVIKRALSPTARMAAKTRSAVSNGGKGGTPGRLVAQGNIEAAQQATATARLNGVLPTKTNPVSQMAAAGETQVQANIDDLAKNVQSLLDTKSYTRNAGHLSVEGANRLLDNLTHNAQLLSSTLEDVIHVSRLSDEAAAVGFAKARTDFLRQYYKLEDHIVDIRNIRESEDIAYGVDRIEVLIGKKNATGFDRETQAKFYAQKMMRLPEGSYDIVAEEGNFFIRMGKNVREDSLEVLDARMTTENLHPVNLQNTFLGMLRGADFTGAKEVQKQAKVATYGGNAVMSRLAEAATSITSLGKNKLERLRGIMEHAQFEWRTITDTDGTTKRVQGRFYKDVNELETAYLAKFNSLPSEEEIEAYFTFRQIMDWDYVQMNLGMVRDMNRLGLEQVSFGFSKEVEGVSRYGQSDFFNGRTVDALPSVSNGHYNVAYVDPKTGKVKLVRTSDPSYLQQQKTLKEIIDGGKHRILQPADPRDDILRDAVGAGGADVDFVVVKDLKTKPLSSVQIPYNEGGHAMYPTTGHYLKQPQTHTARGLRYYDGDKVALYVPSGAQGVEFADSFNAARRMLADPNHTKSDVANFLSTRLPFTYDEFTKMFRDFAGSPKDAPFKLDAPFVLTESGQASTDVIKLADHFSEEIVDTRNSPHSLVNKVNSQFAQQRNERLLTIDSIGNQQNPQFKISHAPMLDPLEALSRTAARMSESRFFDDYKHKAVEEWVFQFADVLDIPLEVLRSDPMRYLKEPVWRESVRKSPKLAAAQNSRRNILSLLREDRQEVKAINYAKQKVVDSVYKAHGKAGVEILEPWLWEANTDPFTITRSAVFHAKLGLFAPVQFPLQALSAMASLAIDGHPIRAMQAPYAYWAMRIRGLSESNLKAQGLISKQVGRALGLSPDTLDEMYDAWRRSGMHIIEGEYSRMDDYLNPRMFFGPDNMVSKTFDYGLIPFKEGNNVHRGTAFASSFLKWKAENPNRILNNRAMGDIVERADLLYHGMSRASNAAWQNGGTLAQQIGSIPAQFFTYHQRLTEQIIGNQLTPAERLRLLTVYAAMWGIPVGVGGTALGAFWPMGEQIRQYMLDNNIDGDANVVTEIFSKGLIGSMADRIVGTDVNVSERFGPSGMSFFRDLVDLVTGNDAGGEVSDLFGAGPGFFSDVMGTFSPFGRAVFTSLNPNSEAYQLTTDDFIGVLRNISSVNTGVRAYQIYTAGQWLTRNENATATFNKEDPALTIAVALGLSPEEVTDAYLKLRSNKEFEQARLSVQREALIEYRRALKSAAGGDYDQADVYFKRAYAIMATAEFTPLEIRNALKQGLRNNEDLIDRVDFDFMKRDPEQRVDEYADDLRRRINTKANNAGVQ